MKPGALQLNHSVLDAVEPENFTSKNRIGEID